MVQLRKAESGKEDGSDWGGGVTTGGWFSLGWLSQVRRVDQKRAA